MARPAALILLFLAIAAPAHAARVRVVVGPEPDGIREDLSDSDQYVLLRAAPGERNRVSVRKRKPDVVVVRDRGATLHPGRRCRRLTRHAVRCRFETDYYAQRFVARLGDRDDRLLHVYGSIDAEVSGGPGDDAVFGGRFNDYLRGGPGDDVLRGHEGYDTLTGGAGRDELAGNKGRDDLTDGPGRDVLKGGPAQDLLHSTDRLSRDLMRGGDGRDTVTYANRRRPVAIALGSGAGEDDILFVEDVQGGLAADTITGDEGANQIDTYGIGDTVDARGGNDIVHSRYAEDITCGTGNDRVVAYEGQPPLLRPDCERVSGAFGYFPATAQPSAVTADTVTLTVPCTTTPAPIRLVTPPVARPWFTTGPFGIVLAHGTTGVGKYTDGCPATLTLTDAGRTLARPIPATVTGTYAKWAFLLAAPGATAR